ncbi:sulfur carrier protein ThiS [Undibacterium fentianense]|uniref:Sulfur carrier protein ThiS n=1 Tax=Undibacterium fentianense TaxID=2828728 RepID=A0A941IG12_9BURK|nr:sulfur carrier protein ThiS [Undibacterium fentianense]MBR7800912.1 sulfur carrier protein ThiS [Undibacterium fentianense]
MEIQLNGELRVLQSETDLHSLITELQLDNQAIAVAVNRQVIRRALWQRHILQAGDQVDVVRAIGGG